MREEQLLVVPIFLDFEDRKSFDFLMSEIFHNFYVIFPYIPLTTYITLNIMISRLEEWRMQNEWKRNTPFDASFYNWDCDETNGFIR